MARRGENPNDGFNDFKWRLGAMRMLGVRVYLTEPQKRRENGFKNFGVPHHMGAEVIVLPVDLSGYHATGGAEGLSHPAAA